MVKSEVFFLLKHSSIYGLGTVVAQLASFILLPLYTKFLRPSDYGVLEAITIATHVVGVVVTLSIARALSRFYYESEGQSERNRVVSTTYVTYLTVAAICAPFLYFIGGPLAGLLFESDGYSYYFKLSFGNLIAAGCLDIGLMYLRLIKKPVIFISVTLTRLSCLIALNVYFVAYREMGLVGILYSSIIVSCLYASVISAGILFQTRLIFSAKVCRDLVKYALPMVPSKFANDIVKQSDKYFVLQMLSAGDLGIYSLALKLGNSLHFLLTMPFNMAFIPRRFEIMERDNAEEVYGKIFTYYIFLVGYAGLALSVLIREILSVMVTPAFMRAGEFVPLVVFSIILLGCHSHFDFGILYSKKTKYLAYISGTSAVLQLGLNYALVRSYGILGALGASITVFACEAAMLYAVGRSFYRIDYEFQRIFQYALVAVVFYLGLRYVDAGNLWLNTGIKGVCLLLFPATLVALKIVRPKEVAILRDLYRKRVILRTSRKCPAKVV